MEHSFIKTGDTHYSYALQVSGSPIESKDFWYGVIVVKLPELARIENVAIVEHSGP